MSGEVVVGEVQAHAAILIGRRRGPGGHDSLLVAMAGLALGWAALASMACCRFWCRGRGAILASASLLARSAAMCSGW